MLKQLKNNRYNIKKSGSSSNYVKSCVWDCSPVTEAKVAYDEAVVARQNAEALRDALQTEMNNVSKALDNYKGTYDTFMSCGDTVANPNNMGSEGGLSSMIECLSTYGSSVSDAYSESVKDVQLCQQAEKAALQANKNAKCVCV